MLQCGQRKGRSRNNGISVSLRGDFFMEPQVAQGRASAPYWVPWAYGPDVSPGWRYDGTYGMPSRKRKPVQKRM